MDANEFKKVYHLDETFRFDRVDFVKNIAHELDALIGEGPTYEEFKMAIASVKGLWESIFRDTKVNDDHQKKFWSFFYATEVIPRRNKMFGERNGPRG